MSKRVVGNKSLSRELLMLKKKGVQSVGAAGSFEILVESLNELRHTHYLVSVICQDNVAAIDALQGGTGEIGAGGGGNAAGLHGTILKRRRTGSAATSFVDVFLLLANNTAATRIISYEVWVFAGLGGNALLEGEV